MRLPFRFDRFGGANNCFFSRLYNTIVNHIDSSCSTVTVDLFNLDGSIPANPFWRKRGRLARVVITRPLRGSRSMPR